MQMVASNAAQARLITMKTQAQTVKSVSMVSTLARVLSPIAKTAAQVSTIMIPMLLRLVIYVQLDGTPQSLEQ